MLQTAHRLKPTWPAIQALGLVSTGPKSQFGKAKATTAIGTTGALRFAIKSSSFKKRSLTLHHAPNPYEPSSISRRLRLFRST